MASGSGTNTNVTSPNFSIVADNDPSNYTKLVDLQDRSLQSKLQSPVRFQRISERADRSDWPPETHRLQNEGRWCTLYRGCKLIKGPEDYVIYHQLLWHVKPPTVIELGTYTGGMAVWIADQMKLFDAPCRVLSVDIDPTLLDEAAKKLKPDNVSFLQGDCYAIQKTFPEEMLIELPHPWVIIDDAHVNFTNVLKYFHSYMKEGDYIVVEDTNPHSPLQLGAPGDTPFDKRGPEKLNSLRAFLKELEEFYAVDSFFTDMYGYNGSWHWHGFIRKMK